MGTAQETKCLLPTDNIDRHRSIFDRGPFILVVDDEPTNRRVLMLLLQRIGCHVIVAKSGLEAIDLYSAIVIDGVILDVSMPNMDGFETTMHIRSHERRIGRRVPIIGISGHAQEEVRIRGLNSGMDEFMTKPINVHRLSRSLLRLFPGRLCGFGESPINRRSSPMDDD